jgi:hypothetical protein
VSIVGRVSDGDKCPLIRAEPHPYGKWFETHLPDVAYQPFVIWQGIFSARREAIQRTSLGIWRNIHSQLSMVRAVRACVRVCVQYHLLIALRTG